MSCNGKARKEHFELGIAEEILRCRDSWEVPIYGHIYADMREDWEVVMTDDVRSVLVDARRTYLELRKLPDNCGNKAIWGAVVERRK